MPSATFNLTRQSSVARETGQLLNYFWSNPNQTITNDNDDYAWLDTSNKNSLVGQGFSPFLCVGSLQNSSSIPDNAVIQGIEVTVRCRAVSNTNVTRNKLIVNTNTIQLIYNNQFISENKSGNEDWKLVDAGWKTFTFGSPTDTWGLNLTPANVKSSGLTGFGISLSVYCEFDLVRTQGET